jgi:hypothetical protein
MNSILPSAYHLSVLGGFEGWFAGTNSSLYYLSEVVDLIRPTPIGNPILREMGGYFLI